MSHRTDTDTSTNTGTGIGLLDTTRPPVVYREMKPRDKAAVRRLWRRFSEPETIGDWFPRAIDDGDFFVYGVTAVRGTTVVGFGLLGWYTAEELADYLTETPEVDAAYPAPVLHLGVVDEQHENQGIATRLMQARVQHAQQQDASYLWGASWRRSGKDSAPVFERCDFQPVHHVNDYYSDRTWCPNCDSPAVKVVEA